MFFNNINQYYYKEGIAKNVLRKDQALTTIVLVVEPSLMYLLGPDPDNPSDVWKRLANQFQKKSWTNKSNFCTIGCSIYVHIPKDERKKIDSKTRPCIFS